MKNTSGVQGKLKVQKVVLKFFYTNNRTEIIIGSVTREIKLFIGYLKVKFLLFIEKNGESRLDSQLLRLNSQYSIPARLIKPEQPLLYNFK